MEILSIVNENDEVVGQEDRKVIHQKGLLHREIHCWFVTPDKKIIFQKRGLHKETYPGLLDATVGGHIDMNESYEDAAIREAKEETGVEIPTTELTFIKKKQSKSFDTVKELTNNKFTTMYAYIYSGNVNDLKLEDGEALGFQAYSISELENLSDEEKKKFISGCVSKEAIEFYKTII